MQRYIIQEWGEIYNIPLFKKGVLATLVAVTCCLLLAFGAGGASGSGGLIIWPLFGSTNQILAGLTLLVLSVMLMKYGRPARYTMLPMVFVLVTSSWAALIKLKEFYEAENWLLVTIDVIVVITTFMVILEAASVIAKIRRDHGCGYIYSGRCPDDHKWLGSAVQHFADAAGDDGGSVRWYHDGLGRPLAALHHPGVGRDL